MNTLIITLTIITLVIWLFGLGYAGYKIFIGRSMVKHPKPCQHESTMKLSSINQQLCYGCNEALPWDLKPNQQPLVSCNRDKRKK